MIYLFFCFFRFIVSPWMRRFGGFRSSRRYHPNQEREILNFRVVPDLQISKYVDLLMIYMHFVWFVYIFLSLFVELRRLWDHSQIVDLIFLIRMVSTRASESSKTPHSWQNNVPKRLKTLLDVFFLSISFFYYFLSPGGSGTTPKL